MMVITLVSSRQLVGETDDNQDKPWSAQSRQRIKLHLK